MSEMKPRKGARRATRTTCEPYARIARHYHLLFDDWDHAVEQEGQRLESILRPHGVRSVFDVTCGTGLQCVSLAKRGFLTTGADISPAMVRQARRNARRAELAVKFQVASATCLPQSYAGHYDAAISCGNSVSHCLTKTALRSLLCSMRALVRNEGLCLIDAWDYQPLLAQRSGNTFTRTATENGHKVVLFDRRSYGKRTMKTEYCLLRETSAGWKTERFVMDLKPWRRDELIEAMTDAGFASIEDISVDGTVQLLGKSAPNGKNPLDSQNPE